MAFFSGNYEGVNLAFCFEFIHFIANVFEAYQKIADAMNIILFRYFFNEQTCHSGFYDSTIRSQKPL